MVPVVGAAMAAGIASSLHCAAMCGPLAITACTGSEGVSLRGAAGYGAGRLGAYTVLGAIAGALGGGVADRLGGPLGQKVVAVALAAALALSALRVLRGVKKPSEQGLVQLRRAKHVKTSRSVGIGLITGLLPCGALATGLLVAASAGSAAAGALAMVVFALASGPGLALAVAVGGTLGRWLLGEAGERRRAVMAAGLLIAGVWIGVRPWMMPPSHCHCADSQGHVAQVAVRTQWRMQ